MNTFALHIVDDRYTVTTLEFVTASSTAAARRVALDRLYASEHHLAVEVHEEGQLLFEINREGQARAS